MDMLNCRMNWARAGLTVRVFVLCALFWTGAARAGDRVALVIGNGAYQRVPALSNPPQDANDLASALQRLDFKVTRLINGTGADMRRAFVEFGHAAEGASVAVVFYAGHGMEVGGENWLIPTDAELRSDADVESEAISLRSVNLQVSKAHQLGLIILDACRNNPFAAKMKRSLATRAVTRGLAPTEPTDNVLVAYAARDGTTASDGDGRNSPFTTALLKHIETPGLEISFLFRRVRDDVMTATKREQQPFVYGSLSKEEIYLKALSAPAAASTQGAPSAQTTAEDDQFWHSIQTSTVPGLYEEFLSRYPGSNHVWEARQRLVDLRASQLAATSPSTSPPSGADPSLKQGPGGSSPASVRPFTNEDNQRVQAIAAQQKLTLPQFTISVDEVDRSSPNSQFVGVWSNKLGWENGEGRYTMLVVTKVSATGLASGYYLWGPPTKRSWQQTPAGYTRFAEYISKNTFTLQVGDTIAVKLDRNTLTMTSARQGKSSDRASIELHPVWQLVEPVREDKKSSARSGSGKRTSTTLIADERRGREMQLTQQPKPEGEDLVARCRQQAHRQLINDSSRIAACAQNGGKI
ncbi:caspase family protein [Bradyrhizobium sp. CCGUVB4N]|uniref:caspase family protein n=1 Tax=Bradyrhizobium sp. CCGUVB4N TaxID=2949631 RepID=UPI0020B23191|nr:caspase family protein [Bradyrhizobium sp. CCGUVB4N]MCP3385186.1 caspase family protein [Bradyrhizobium sp. CCGUVB4N]